MPGLLRALDLRRKNKFHNEFSRLETSPHYEKEESPLEPARPAAPPKSCTLPSDSKSSTLPSVLPRRAMSLNTGVRRKPVPSRTKTPSLRRTVSGLIRSPSLNDLNPRRKASAGTDDTNTDTADGSGTYHLPHRLSVISERTEPCATPQPRFRAKKTVTFALLDVERASQSGPQGHDDGDGDGGADADRLLPRSETAPEMASTGEWNDVGFSDLRRANGGRSVGSRVKANINKPRSNVVISQATPTTRESRTVIASPGLQPPPDSFTATIPRRPVPKPALARKISPPELWLSQQHSRGTSPSKQAFKSRPTAETTSLSVSGEIKAYPVPIWAIPQPMSLSRTDSQGSASSHHYTVFPNIKTPLTQNTAQPCSTLQGKSTSSTPKPPAPRRAPPPPPGNTSRKSQLVSRRRSSSHSTANSRPRSNSSQRRSHSPLEHLEHKIASELRSLGEPTPNDMPYRNPELPLLIAGPGSSRCLPRLKSVNIASVSPLKKLEQRLHMLKKHVGRLEDMKKGRRWSRVGSVSPEKKRLSGGGWEK